MNWNRPDAPRFDRLADTTSEKNGTCVSVAEKQSGTAEEVAPWVAAGFEPVRDVFLQLHEDGEELGSALSVYHRGKPVVDLWDGYSAPERQHRWRKDTLVSTFSACKAMTALCLL